MPTLVSGYEYYNGEQLSESNGRHICRTSNGVLWIIRNHNNSADGGGPYRLYYSTDNGATWTASSSWGGGNYNYSPYFAIYIDSGDNIHVFMSNIGDGGAQYTRGTPNAGRTGFSFGGVYSIGSSNVFKNYDAIAHVEGAGWAIHVVATTSTGGVYYAKQTINSSGTVGTSSLASVGTASANARLSIDFYHNGDGKTIKDGTPHIFIGWASTGGVRMMKGTYSAGVWTFGAQQVLDSVANVDSSEITGAFTWSTAFFDGTRFVVVGSFNENSTAANHVTAYDRDAADTTTTVHRLIGSPGVVVGTTDALLDGSATYDSGGNIYIVGRSNEGTDGTRNIYYRKWIRTSDTLADKVLIDNGGSNSPSVVVRRDLSSNILEFVYGKKNVNNDSTWYMSGPTFNSPPIVSITSHVGGEQFDPRLPLTIDFSYADADGDLQTQREYGWRVSGGSWVSNIASTPSTSFTIPRNTVPDESDIEVRVSAFDGKDWGPYDTVSLKTDSWTYLPEVVSSATSGAIDATAFDEAMEVSVRTSDASGFGPWSKPLAFEGEQVLVWNGEDWFYLGTIQGYDTAWEGNPGSVFDGTQFKPMKVR